MAKYTIRKEDFVRRMGLPDNATIVAVTEDGFDVTIELSGLDHPSSQDHFGGTVSVGAPHDWIQWVVGQGDQRVTFWGDRRVIEYTPPPALDWDN